MSLLYNFVELSACILTCIYFLMLADIFFARSASFKLWKYVIVSAVVILLTYFPQELFRNSIASVMVNLMFLAVLLLYFDGSTAYKLLVLLLFNAVDLLLANSLMSIFIQLQFGTGESLSSSGSSERILFLLIHYLLELVLLLIAGHFRYYELSVGSKEWIIIILFFVCIFSITFMIYAALRTGSSFEMSHDIAMLFFSMISVLLLLIFFGIYLLRLVNMRNHEEAIRKLMTLQISEQEKLLLETKEHFETVRQIRHDMKRYLTNYRLLLTKGKSEEVLKSINTLLDAPLEAVEINYTDNLLLNAMLHSFRRSCLENFVIFEQRILIHPLFENIELMILLSNLFDNALEAELEIPRSDRRINLEIVDDSSYISIIIQNHIEKSVLASNHKLETTKKSGGDHGIGLKSVYQILKQSHGNIDIYEENEFFCVHVLFPIS